MDSKSIADGIVKALLILIGFVLVLFFLHKIKPVLIYLVIAAVISLIARPGIRFLKKKLNFPNLLAVFVIMGVFVFFLVGMTRMFIPLFLKQGENLSLLNTTEFKNDIERLLNEINSYFFNKGIDIFEQFKIFDLLSNIKDIPNLLNTLIEGIGSVSIAVFSVIFISFFLIKDNLLIHKNLLLLIPNTKEKRVAKSLNTIKELLSRYFIGLLFQITILFTIYTGILLVFGIENAIIIAFLCAILNLIPFIGPLIGGLLMFVLTMTENIGLNFQTEILPTTLYVMTGYFMAQLIDNLISQPLIFSKSVKSHPLEIFLIISLGGLLFGVVGMIIAVPTYTVIKVILKEFFSDNKIVKSLTKDI